MAEEQPVTYTSGDYQYILLPDGTAEITKYIGKAENQEIPSELDGHTVSSIGNRAFAGNNKIVSIDIPNSIIFVENNPFSGCSSLMYFSVAPDHPTLAVNDGVLFQEKKLICYPSNKKERVYSIPDGTQEIGDYAFSNCKNLVDVTIPDSIIHIDNIPFIYCNNLSAIHVSPDHPLFADIKGVLFQKDEKRLVCYPAKRRDESYSIPKGILEISEFAFCHCFYLTNITIPDSVVNIQKYAFCNCPVLSEIDIPNSVETINEGTFYECSSLTNVNLGDKISRIGDYAFYFCEELKNIIIPDSVTEIGEGAFCFCFSLTNVLMPKNLNSIGDSAFSYCNRLISIIIPNNISDINDTIFSGCTKLSNIMIPESVISISENAFVDCPVSLTLIVERDSYALQYCKQKGIGYNYPDALDWLNN